MSLSEVPVVTGQCLCGAIEFVVKGAALWTLHCHCRTCRKVSGAAVATFVGFRLQDYQYIRGEPTEYESSPGVSRAFCPKCGTSLCYEAERFPDEVHVHISVLDAPQNFVPQCHIYFSERLPWFDTADALPRYLTTGSGPLHSE